jgi:hypothetical protein
MRIGRTVPSEYFVLRVYRGEDARFEGASSVVGYLDGRPIVDTVIDDAGCRYRYVGLAARLRDGRVDVLSLRPGEWIVEPGLIYAAEAPIRRRGER